ncbi:hypothetical protein LCGC14_0854160 [marine sediment metagenome]|uniref:Uncharacterized protein n=1 Tax=marine sediment metagenome TaxID=412755 RepID=A0A0F9SGG4_9ZZZZ
MPSKSAKAGASIKLLDINSELHELIPIIDSAKGVEENILPAYIIPQALKLGLEGQKLTKEFLPDAVELDYHIDPDTKQKLPGINPLVTVLQSMNEAFQPENDTVQVFAGTRKFLAYTVIDRLSNLIHDVAMKLIATNQQIQACSATTIAPDEAAAIAKYCSGVLTSAKVITLPKIKYLPATITGGHKNVVQTYKTNVVQTLGVVQAHKVEASTLTTGKKPNVAINYHDSYGTGHAGSVGRLKGVQARLEKEGLLCFNKHPNLYCSGEFDEDKLTQLAAFFSLVIDADVASMGNDTVPVVSDALWEFTGKLAAQHGDDTWKSGQGHINWDTMHQKWLKDKAKKEEMELTKIYGDLKQLAIHRDKHHEMENAAGLQSGKTATGKPKADITANAEKAIALSKKNKWGGHYLGEAQNLLKQYINTGGSSTSDLLGNAIHSILYTELQKLGEYGNCPTNINLSDVNAGALSYCEGTLKGTTTILQGEGSQPLHKVAPKQYNLIIEDDNPEGGYNVFIPIDKGFWSEELAGFLEDKFGFDCETFGKGKWKPGEVCRVHIDSHDKIRLLAIFLSNLKGGSESLGKECVPIAMQEAWNYAQEQAKKGTMSFTQEPLIESAKQWIDKCYKTYGIMPPGLTEEQKTLLQLIGPDKIYAGCNLTAEETVPNMGIINYCEGVRTNPDAVVNAHLTPQGSLAHFFHATQDKLADIFINPVDGGKYSVEIKNLDFRNNMFTQKVIDLLQAANYTCQGKTCQKEISEPEIRHLAMLLSSLHQAYKLDGSQMSAAINLAQQQIEALPNDKMAYQLLVYPYTVEDWKKELGKAPTAAKPPAAAKPQPYVGAGFKWQNILETIHLPKGDKNLSIPKAQILELLDAGVPEGKIVGFLTNESAWDNTGGASSISKSDALEVVAIILKEKPEAKPETIKGVMQPPVPAGKIYPSLTWAYINGLPNKGTGPWDLGGCVSYISAGPTKIKKGYCAGVIKEAIDSEGHEIPLEGIAILTGKGDTHGITGDGDITFDSKYSELFITLPDELDKIEPLKIALEEKLGFYHVEGSTWKKKATVFNAAKVGYFFSHIHNITGLPKSCWGDAVNHALEQFNESNPPLKPVYPFTTVDWMKDVCKIEAPTEEPPQPIDELIQKVSADMALSYKSITPDQKKKAKETKEYKKLPQKVKNWMHLAINNHLLQNHKANKPLEETLSQLNHLFLELNDFGITPLMVKKQMEIEKKRKIRKGELPAEPGEVVEKQLQKDSSAELENEIMNELKDLYDSGFTKPPDLFNEVQKTLGLKHSPYLADFVYDWHKGYKQEIIKSNEPILYSTLPEDLKALLNASISIKAAEGKDADIILNELSEQFNVKSTMDWEILVAKEVEAYQALLAKKKTETPSNLWEDLPPSEKKNYILEAYGWAKDNPEYGPAQIIAALSSKYGFEVNNTINKVAEQVVQSAKALKEGKINKATYTTPWELGEGGWEAIPLELAVCMGTALNKLDPEATLTGLYAPFFNLKKQGFSEFDIQELWEGCVVQYEAGLKEPEGKPVLGPQELKNWMFSYLKSHPGIQVSPESMQVTINAESEVYSSPGASSVKAMLDELVQEGKILWNLSQGLYLFEGPVAEKAVEKEPDGKLLNLTASSEHAEIYAVVKSRVIKNADTYKKHTYPGIVNDVYQHIAVMVPSISPLQIEEMIEIISTELKLFPDSKPFLECFKEKLGNLTDFYHAPFFDLWEECKEGEIEKEIPSIEEFMDAEPATAEEAEQLTVHLLEQNKYSANEISLALANKYAIKDDLKLTEWIVKIKDHHGLKVQVGPKFEEMPDEAKKDIIDYITDHSDWDEDVILSYIYDNLGVMASDVLKKEIRHFKKGYDEMQAKQEEPEAPEKPISYENLTGDMKHDINLAVEGMVKSGTGGDDLVQAIVNNYDLAEDAETDAWLEGVIEYHTNLLDEEPETPSPQEMDNFDEMIKSYYQMGWTPAAVMEFFAYKMPADQLKKTADKLYKIYKPEVVRITQDYSQLHADLKKHLEGVASKLLNEGKGVADVAWYISVNYGIEKESVKVMVRKVAEKPLEQVEAAVKAMQLLGAGEFIGGCEITEPISDLRPQNVAYCQGVLEKKGELENSGASILHAMGHQEIRVFNDITDSKWETKMVLETDGGENNEEKLQGVWDILNNIMNCQYPGGTVVTCQLSGSDGMTLPISDQDKLRKTALFLSSIDNVAQLDKGCIPYALKFAMEAAKKKNETSQPWTVNVYPKEVEDWNTIVCSKILA